MALLFAGGELEAFTASSSNVVEVTTAGYFDSAYARCAIRTGSGSTSDYADSPAFTSATTVWIHWEWLLGSSTSNSGSTLITCYNSSGTAVFRLQFTATMVLQAQYWNGSTWVNIGSTITLATGSRYVFDLKIICGGSGSFELYQNSSGPAVLSGSASMTSVDNIAKIRAHASSTGATSNNTHFSQIVVADECTIGWKFELEPPTGNSATNTAWTGAFGDVDETVLNDADLITSSTADQLETFTSAAPSTVPTAMTVKGVVVSARAKNAASGPQNMQFALRISSTDYTTSSVSGIGTGFVPFVNVYTLDPSTSAAWTSANAVSSSLEFGVKSIT